MKIHCPNINHPDYKNLLEKTGLSKIDLLNKVSMWQQNNDAIDMFPPLEYFNLNEVVYQFKSVQKIYDNLDKVVKWYGTKGLDFWSKLQQDLQIPKEQIELLKETYNNLLNKARIGIPSNQEFIEEMLADFAANYSYTVEINTAKENIQKGRTDFNEEFDEIPPYEKDGKYYATDGIEEFEISKEKYESFFKPPLQNTQHYSNLTVPGGTNYTEHEIATPGIKVPEQVLKTSLGKELEYKDSYVPSNRLKYFKQYQVLDEKGNDIGSVVIEYRGTNTVILHPKLKIEGKGYGKDLYKFISNKFNVEIQEWNEGAIANSIAAKKMWDSLEKEGAAKRIISEDGDNFRVLKYNAKTIIKGAITPSIKGHAQFATDKGIGWFRSDDAKTKNILPFIKSNNTIDDDFFVKDIILAKDLQNIRTNNWNGSINIKLKRFKDRYFDSFTNEPLVSLDTKIDVSEFTKPSKTTLNEIIEKVNLSESNKILFQKIKPLVKDVNIEYVEEFFLSDSGAVYSDKYNTIRINKSEKNIPLEELIMHELLHAATFRKISHFEKDTGKLSKIEQEALNELEKIRLILKEESKKWWDKPRRAREVNMLEGYTTDSIHEIISYTFTNESFRKQIENIPYNQNKSILDKLIELIANIFNAKENTILNALLSNAEVLLQDKVNTKTRRILEVQSDLFQKGRGEKNLITPQSEGILLPKSKFTKITKKEYLEAKEKGKKTFGAGTNEFGYSTTYEYNNKLYTEIDNNEYGYLDKTQDDVSSENQFLQLLNKDNNWVTFFVKSIIQDSAKKGYEKVLFPTGNTASKVEGHTTLEEFKKQKEDRIKELEKRIENKDEEVKDYISGKNKGITESDKNILLREIDSSYKEINQLKQELERVETEGFGALQPIYNFYENTVTNILKKQGYNPVLITDEYGNTWNEIELTEETKNKVLLSPSDQPINEKNPDETIKQIIAIFKNKKVARFKHDMLFEKQHFFTEGENLKNELNHKYNKLGYYITKHRVKSKLGKAGNFLYYFKIQKLNVPPKSQQLTLFYPAKESKSFDDQMQDFTEKINSTESYSTEYINFKVDHLFAETIKMMLSDNIDFNNAFDKLMSITDLGEAIIDDIDLFKQKTLDKIKRVVSKKLFEDEGESEEYTSNERKSFKDNSTFETDNVKKASDRLKLIFSSIYRTEYRDGEITGVMADVEGDIIIKTVSPDEVLNKVKLILADSMPVFDEMITKLEEAAKYTPYLHQVVTALKNEIVIDNKKQKKFKNLNNIKQLQREFTTIMANNSYNPSVVLATPVSVTENGVKKIVGHESKIIEADQRTTVKALIEDWRENFKDNFEYVTLDNEKGHVINTEKIQNDFFNYYVQHTELLQTLKTPQEKYEANVDFIIDFFDRLGITISDNTLDELLEIGNELFSRGDRKNNYIFQLASYTKKSNKGESNYETNNPLFSKAILDIAKLEAKNSKELYAQSTLGVKNNQINSINISRELNRRIVKLKNSPAFAAELLRIPYNQSPNLNKLVQTKQLTYLERFEQGDDNITLSLYAGESNPFRVIGKEISDLTPVDLEGQKIMLYQNAGNNKFAKFLHYTPGKETGYIVNAPKLNFNTKDEIIDVLGQIAQAEINRINNVHIPVEKRKFFIFNNLNSFIDKQTKKVSLSDENLLAIRKQLSEEYEFYLNDLKQRWINLDIIDGQTNKFKKYFNPESNTEVDNFIQEYIINQLWFQFNATQTLTSDLANFKSIKDYFKRLTGFQGSKQTPALEDKVTHLQLIVQDKIKNSDFLSEIPKENREGFKNINLTDAQGYSTYTFALYDLKQLGRISDEAYNIVKDKLDRQSKASVLTDDMKLSSDELSLLLEGTFGAKKPLTLARRTLYDPNGSPVLEVAEYVKESFFPLIRQVTEGTELDVLRKAMEKVEKQSGLLTKASHASAYKLGNVNIAEIYDEEGNIKSDLSFSYDKELEKYPFFKGDDAKDRKYNNTNNGVLIDREYYGEQQSIPSKDETKVVDGSQQRKIYELASVINPALKPLIDRYEELYKGLYEQSAKELIDELQVDGKTDIKKLEALLKEEAEERGWSEYDIKYIKVVDDQFTVPLYLAPTHTKIESLLQSLISNKVTKIKRNGYSFVLASQDDWKGLSEEIEYTSNFDVEYGKLKYIAENNYAQVFIPNKFKYKLKTKIYEDSKRKFEVIDMEDEDNLKILQGVGYRIPTQGFNSMSLIEVAGFLPSWMGNIIIAPSEFIAQMGSDFDVDKLYTFFNDVVTIDGKQQVLTSNNLDAYIDNFLKSNFTENEIKEILNEKEDYLNKIKQKLQKRIVFNEILDIQKQILNDEKISSHVRKALTSDEIDPNKNEYIGSLVKNLNKKEAWNLYDGLFSDKFNEASVGNDGIGIFASFNNLLIALSKSEVEIAGSNIKLSNIYANNGTLKIDVSSSFLSGAVDNANNPILGLINVNQETFNVVKGMIASGYNEKDIVTFLLNDYTLELTNLRSNFRNQEEMKGKNIDNEVLKTLGVKKAKKLVSLDIYNKEKNDKIKANFVNKFNEFDQIGKELSRLGSLINTESKNLPKFVFDTFDKIKEIDFILNTEAESKTGEGNGFYYLKNVSSIFSNNIMSYATDFGLRTSEELYKELYKPYRSGSLLTETIESIKIQKGEPTLDSHFKRTVQEGYKAFLYSKASESLLYDTSLYEYRRNLVDELPNLIQQLKKEHPDHLFLSLLYVKNDNGIKTIMLDNQKTIGLDEDHIHKSLNHLIIDELNEFKTLEEKQQLENENYPVVKSAGFKLIEYALITNPNSKLNSFARFIPIDFLESFGVAEGLNDSPNQNIFKTRFNEELHQHYPTLGRSINKTDIEESKVGDKIYYNIKIDLGKTEEIKNIDFVQYYDNDIKAYKLFKRIDSVDKNVGVYQEIHLLGTGNKRNKTEFDFSGSYPSIYRGNNKVTGNKYVIVKDNSNSELSIQGKTNNASFSFYEKFNNTKPILFQLQKRTNNEGHKTLANLFTKTNVVNNVVFDYNFEHPGSYSNNKIIINPNRIKNNDDFNTVFLHEALHGIMDRVTTLNKNNENVKTLIARLDGIRENLQKQMEKQYGEEVVNQFKEKNSLLKQKQEVSLTVQERVLYHLNTFDEFVTGIFENETIQEELKKKQFNSQKTLYERFIETIIEFFNNFLDLKGNKIEKGTELYQAIEDVVSLVLTQQDQYVPVNQTKDIPSTQPFDMGDFDPDMMFSDPNFNDVNTGVDRFFDEQIPPDLPSGFDIDDRLSPNKETVNFIIDNLEQEFGVKNRIFTFKEANEIIRDINYNIGTQYYATKVPQGNVYRVVIKKSEVGLLFPNQNSKNKYKNIKIEYTNQIKNNEGNRGAAQYNHVTKTIKLDKELLLQKYKEKAWTKPRLLTEILNSVKVTSQAKTLKENEFSNYQEWENFVIEHEYQHSIYTRQMFNKDFPNGTKGEYETKINERSLNNLIKNKEEDDRYKAIINGLKNQLYGLKNRVSERREESVNRELNLRIEALEKQIYNLERDNSFNYLIETADAQLETVRYLLNKPYKHQEDLLQAIKISSMWAGLREFILTDEEKIDKDFTKTDIYKTFIDTETDAKILLEKSLIEVIPYLKNLAEKFGINTDVHTFDAALKDIDFFNLQALPIQDVEGGMEQLFSHMLNQAHNYASFEQLDVFKDIDTKFAPFLKSNFFKINGYDKFKNKNGGLLDIRTPEYYDELNRLKRLKDESKGNNDEKEHKQNYVNFIKNNNENIDIRELYTKDVNGYYIEKDNTDYINKIKQKYGVVRGLDAINYAKDKIERYNTELKKRYEKYTSGDNVVIEPILEFQYKNDPFTVFEFNENPNKVPNYIDDTPIYPSYKYIHSEPVEKYTDKEYLALQTYEENGERIAYDTLKYFKAIATQYYKYAPKHIQDHFNSSSLPVLPLDLLEYATQNGFQGLNISDRVIQALREKQDNSTIKLDSVTGNIEHYLNYNIKPAEYLTDVEKEIAAKNTVNDMPVLLKYIVKQSLQYKHLSQIEDKIKLMQAVYNYQSEKIEKGTQSVERKGFLLNRKKKFDFNVNSGFYNISEADPLDINITNTVFTENERKILDSLKVAEEKLAKDLADGKISDKYFKDEMKKINSKISSLGGKVTVKKTVRGFLNYVQLVGMGYGTMSAINNMIFENISTYIHATGGEDFTVKDFNKASKLASTSFLNLLPGIGIGGILGTLILPGAGTLIGSSLGALLSADNKLTTESKKIAGIMRNLDALGDTIDINDFEKNYLKEDRKWWQRLSPYELQRRSEYLAYATSTLAYLLSEKQSSKLNLKEGVTLYDVFDNNGFIKDEYKDIIDRENFSDLKNKVKELNIKLHGNYDKKSPIYGKSTTIGQGLFQFKSWMPQAIDARLGARRDNSFLQREIMGRWRVLAGTDQNNIANWKKNGMRIVRKLIPYINRNESYTDLTEIEKAALNKIVTEMRIYLLFAGMYFLANGLKDDDDEDSYVSNMMLNLIVRTQNDLDMYFSPGEVGNLLSPASLRTLNKSFKVIGNSFDIMFDDEANDDRVSNNQLQLLKLVPLVSGGVTTYNTGKQVFNQ